MSTPSAPSEPRGRAYLVSAAGIACLEAAGLAVFGVLELVHLNRAQPTVSLTSTAFFWLLAAGLAWCAWHLAHATRWARSPVLLAQLFGLGIALDTVHSSLPIAIATAIPPVAIGALVLNPASSATFDHVSPAGEDAD